MFSLVLVGPGAEELTSLTSQVRHLQVVSMVLESDMLWVIFLVFVIFFL